MVAPTTSLLGHGGRHHDNHRWRGPGGQVVARGLVNYDVAEIPALMGRSTRSLAAELGPEYARAVVHRDDLVILARPARQAARPPGPRHR